MSNQEIVTCRPGKERTAPSEWNGTAYRACRGPHVSNPSPKDAQASPTVKCPRQNVIFIFRLIRLRSDLSAAIVLMQPPRLQPTLLDPDVSAYFGPPSYCTIRHARTLGTCLTNFTASQELSEVAVNIYWGLRNISASLEAIQAGTEVADAVEECVQFSDRVEVLERATHTFWYCDAEDSTSSIFRLFGWASLIHIYTVLRELPAELRIMKLVATRIKAEMEKCLNLNVLLATFKDLMLWIIFLGGRVSDVSYKPFFAQQAAKILLVINITEDQADILQASQRFLWPERSVLKC